MPEKINSNEYKLKVENMHGDADASTYTEHYFTKGQLPMLKDVLETIENCKGLNREEIGELTSKLQDRYPDSDLESLFENDATADHQWSCRPSVSSLVWYDAEGKRFAVNVKYGD